MDSLTQVVLGAAVGEAALGKKAGNKALLYGAIAGTIPDLDVFFGAFTDTITAIEWHRGFSHSIFFSILFAPALGWLVNKLERKLNLGWRSWAKLFFLGLITHPLLDLFTTWGTQLFWPLGPRLAFNSIFVIDPLYTIPFLVCTIWVLFLKRTSVRRKRINKIGLYISSSYLIITLAVKWMAHSAFENALEDQQIAYSQMSTRPAPFNIVLWNANVDTEDAYLIGDYSFFDSKPISFKKFPKNRAQSKAIESNPNVQRLITISDGWYILEQIRDHWYFYDLRFGTIPQADGSSTFSFTYALTLENGVYTATEEPKGREDAEFLLASLWDRIGGN